jgi:hypothetical protein
MIEHNSESAGHPLRIETASLERGANKRRILFDESVARAAYGSDDRVRAGILRSPLEWATAAVHHWFGSDRRKPSDTPEIEIR